MAAPAGPSPAGLGVIALAGFAALVAAAFASGYHLVGGASEGSTPFVSVGARTAIVRGSLPPDRGVVRTGPEDAASILARLPSGLAVTVTSESGEYAQIRYERQGQTYEGWTPKSNLELR